MRTRSRQASNAYGVFRPTQLPSLDVLNQVNIVADTSLHRRRVLLYDAPTTRGHNQSRTCDPFMTARWLTPMAKIRQNKTQLRLCRYPTLPSCRWANGSWIQIMNIPPPDPFPHLYHTYHQYFFIKAHHVLYQCNKHAHTISATVRCNSEHHDSFICFLYYHKFVCSWYSCICIREAIKKATWFTEATACEILKTGSKTRSAAAAGGAYPTIRWTTAFCCTASLLSKSEKFCKSKLA